MTDKIKLTINEDEKTISLQTKRELNNIILNELTNYEVTNFFDEWLYTVKALPSQAFVLLCVYSKMPQAFDVSDEDIEFLKSCSSSLPRPQVAVKEGVQKVFFMIPGLPTYQSFVKALRMSYSRLNIYSVPFGRFYEAVRYVKSWNHPFLPGFTISDTFESLIDNQIDNTYTLDQFTKVKLNELRSIKWGYQIKPEGFTKLKIETGADLLFHRPTSYTDRTETFKTISDCPFGTDCFIEGEIEYIGVGGKNIRLTTGDRFFTNYKTWKIQQFSIGDRITLQGKRSRNSFTVSEVYSAWEVQSLPIAPKYPASPTNNIKSELFINCVQELLYRIDGSEYCGYLENMPLTFWGAVHSLHFPKSRGDYLNAINTLAYMELVYLQLIFQDRKEKEGEVIGLSKMGKENGFYESAIRNLPFELTESQNNALDRIIPLLKDKEAKKMLLSADVGAGKTVMSELACLYTLDSGYQSTLIAPTEVLATQLYESFENLIANMDKKPNVVFLSGAMTTKEQNDVKKGIASGKVDIVVGTHSVFNCDFKNLGLICIDEQQKFGAEQREKLIYSRSDGKVPDLLSQTATPIPRSTALAFYGDVELISIEGKPKGRLPIKTEWVNQEPDDFLNEYNPTWQKIEEELSNGRKVFFVTSAVNKNNKTNRVSVEECYDKVIRMLPQFNASMIHGKVKKEEQNQIIDDFKNGDTQILIASSIIEVGVDIPDATVMVVIQANCFGASSLHQIRGRVGRNSYQSYCYLVATATTKQAESRLNSLVASNNGFEIALTDLMTRQQGDVLGVKQSGETSRLRFSDLVNHADMIYSAKEDAYNLYHSKYRNQAMADANAFLKIEGDE